MRNSILFFVLVLLVATQSIAQQNITGTITDNLGNPVIDATIIIKGTDTKTVSNQNGNYSILVPAGYKMLSFQKDGFKVTDAEVNNSVINITMSKDDVDLFNLTLEELMQYEVKGVSQYAQKLSDVPANVMVITKDQIKTRGYNDLSDVLKDLPGFDIIENANRFGEFYTIRGTNGNDRFLILINGRKINGASGWFVSVGNSFSVENMERVEIIYGASSIMYGSDAFSAIINLIPAESESNNLHFSSDYGSFNSVNTNASATVLLGDDITFTANAHLYKSDGFAFADTGAYSVVKNYTSPLYPKFEQPINDHDFYAELKVKKFRFGYFNRLFSEGNAMGHNPATYIFNKENVWKGHCSYLSICE